MTETNTTKSSNFPYGTFVVSQAVSDQYHHASLSRKYPLPEVLPLHHPVLQALEGIYPLVDALPPWWNDCVEQCDSYVQSLLQGVTIREFRDGSCNEQRWRLWRQELSEATRAALQESSYLSALRSPKILPLLYFYWRDRFEERGDKETPETLDLVISFRPEYLLNMSNGNGWKSCQHLYYGSVNECLPPNWYDTGVAVAMLLPRGADIWDGVDIAKKGVVLTRTTLRVFPDPQREQHFLIAIGRTYGNNPTLLALLLSQLITIFEERQLSWSVIDYSGIRAVIETGIMGKRYCTYFRTYQYVEGISFWRPEEWSLPFVDSDEGYWYNTDKNLNVFKTSICSYNEARLDL